jgi:hypothetical protein
MKAIPLFPLRLWFRLSCQPLGLQPCAVFMQGFLSPFMIRHGLLGFDLLGRIPKF